MCMAMAVTPVDTIGAGQAGFCTSALGCCLCCHVTCSAPNWGLRATIAVECGCCAGAPLCASTGEPMPAYGAPDATAAIEKRYRGGVPAAGEEAFAPFKRRWGLLFLTAAGVRSG